jgi:hypothetical protein
MMPLYTEQQAAEILHRSVRSLLNDRKAGRIQFIRLGGPSGRGVRYRPEHIDEFLRANQGVFTAKPAREASTQPLSRASHGLRDGTT